MCSHLNKLFREYSDKHRDGVNQRKQALITKFLRTPVTSPDVEPVASTSTTSISPTPDEDEDMDFEGFKAAVSSYTSRVPITFSDDSDDDDAGVPLSGPQ